MIGLAKFTSHMKTHELFKCENCNIAISMHNKARHLKICLLKDANIGDLKCDECEYVTSRRDNLKKHMKTHSSKTCSICGHKEKTAKKLEQHLKSVHVPSVPVQFYCKYCDFSSPRKWNLLRHEKKHNQDNNSTQSLPEDFQDIYEVFISVDRIIALLHNRKETITYEQIKKSMQEMTRKNFPLSYMMQIKSVLPEGYKVYWNPRLQDYEFTVELKGKLSPTILESRHKLLYKRLLSKLKSGCDSIQESEFPPPSKKGNMTVSQVLKKFPINSENSKPAAPAVLRNSVSKSLKNVSKGVIDRVLMREAMAASRSSNTGEQTRIEKCRIQKMARILRQLYVTEGKQALTLEYVLIKLKESTAVPVDVMLKDIKELEVISKKWVMQVKSKGDVYLKLNMDTNFDEILAVING